MKKSKMLSLIILLMSFFLLNSCGSFKAQRVSSKDADKAAMEITDNWVAGDTELAINQTMEQLQNHKAFRKYLSSHEGPKVFVGEVQNQSSEAYFPIDDLNDEFLTRISNSGEFVLVDAAAREKILKEITYQHDGMVDPATAKSIGKQTGADLMIFGSVYMKPEVRNGKTIKEYTVNLRMTDIEKGVEVLRTRAKVSKFSDQSSGTW